MRERLETLFVTERIPDWQALVGLAKSMPAGPDRNALYDVIRHSVLFKLSCYLGTVPVSERLLALGDMLAVLQQAGFLTKATVNGTAKRLPVTTHPKPRRALGSPP